MGNQLKTIKYSNPQPCSIPYQPPTSLPWFQHPFITHTVSDQTKLVQEQNQERAHSSSLLSDTTTKQTVPMVDNSQLLRTPMPSTPSTVDKSSQVAELTMSTTTKKECKRRLWAHIYLDMQEPGFDLVPKLIGRNGCNMKNIFEQTRAKVRVRGRGSLHFEPASHMEAPTPLMIAVTTEYGERCMFRKAIQMTLRLLKAVEHSFTTFCAIRGHQFIGPGYSIGLCCNAVSEMLKEVFYDDDNVPSLATSLA